MTDPNTWIHLGALIATAIGATWTLRGALSRQTEEFKGAIGDLKEALMKNIHDLESRVIKLESRRGKR